MTVEELNTPPNEVVNGKFTWRMRGYSRAIEWECIVNGATIGSVRRSGANEFTGFSVICGHTPTVTLEESKKLMEDAVNNWIGGIPK